MQRLLISRINALKMVSYGVSFKTRKMLANSLIISRLIYVIQLWGGTSEFLLNILQVIQNSAARTVTRRGWFTPQLILLRETGWLSVRQLAAYHNMVMVFKMKNTGKPVCFQEIVKKPFPYETRQATGNGIVENQCISRDITKKAFVNKSTKMWNSLPPQICQESSSNKFKSKVKIWIRENHPM